MTTSTLSPTKLTKTAKYISSISSISSIKSPFKISPLKYRKNGNTTPMSMNYGSKVQALSPRKLFALKKPPGLPKINVDYKNSQQFDASLCMPSTASSMASMASMASNSFVFLVIFIYVLYTYI